MLSKDDIRIAAEGDFYSFVKLVLPEHVWGMCHEDVFSWMEREDHKSHQLILLPRDHKKSVVIALRVAWYITKDPSLRVLYISATANLAEKQLGFIKGLITSDTYRRYWPEHVNRDEGKRARWTTSEISLDHPIRKIENVRDPTIFTGGLTTSLTGMHCDIAVLDDVVVGDNANNEEGRTKVKNQYSLLSSIEGTNAQEWVVGTRYHPKDLYNDLLTMVEDLYDDTGDKVAETPIYEVYQKGVEDTGEGNGEFLWPRQQRKDGKWFGFDRQVLARKRGQYLDRGQFRAQYYNDPSDPDNVPVAPDRFQYYERKFLVQENGFWYYRQKRLNVFASMDFAFSLSKKADYTTIVVIGIDAEGAIYVLDIDRFRTDRIKDYFDHLFALSDKWSLRKVRAEVTVAQQAIVNQLKDLIRANGMSISIDEYRPKGNKKDRISATLEPRYDNQTIWHYRGGNIQYLEDELATRNPSHDDVIDALASAIDMAVKPTRNTTKHKASAIDWGSMRFRGNK
jgi:phage terminase large subunit-like protein